MVLIIAKAAGVILVITLIILLVVLLLSAVDMPQSWDETTGEYTRCSNCDWDAPEKFSDLHQPSDNCRRCPFCWKPDDKQMVD